MCVYTSNLLECVCSAEFQNYVILRGNRKYLYVSTMRRCMCMSEEVKRAGIDRNFTVCKIAVFALTFNVRLLYNCLDVRKMFGFCVNT